MGHLRVPRRVTPLLAMLAPDPAYLQLARAPLEAIFGPLELQSPLYPFEGTNYYASTMGQHLKRQFFTFKPLSDPAALPDWKLATNRLEVEITSTLAQNGQPDHPKRPINLDAGYITGAKLVLASTKDFAHRIYLRDGIFAEITMGFRRDSWVSHYFTFPDYKSGMYDEFFKKARDWHLRKVKRDARARAVE
jgi:hypothetical protein